MLTCVILRWKEEVSGRRWRSRWPSAAARPENSTSACSAQTAMRDFFMEIFFKPHSHLVFIFFIRKSGRGGQSRKIGPTFKAASFSWLEKVNWGGGGDVWEGMTFSGGGGGGCGGGCGNNLPAAASTGPREGARSVGGWRHRRRALSKEKKVLYLSSKDTRDTRYFFKNSLFQF